MVIFRGKILVLYKNYKNRYEGWVLPKGTVEPGEDFKETAIREVKEESGVDARIVKYIGKSSYTFNIQQETCAVVIFVAVFPSKSFANASHFSFVRLAIQSSANTSLT